MRNWLVNIYTLYFYIMCFFLKNIKIERCKFILAQVKVLGVNRVEFNDSYINKSSLCVSGNNNNVKIGGEVYSCNIKIIGNNNTCIIESDSKIYNSNLIIRGNGCLFRFGKKSTIASAHLVCMGKDNSLIVGQECMISDNVNIWNSDSHPIIDKQSSDIINPSSPIIIGNHVWIGKNSSILKGSVINDGTVVGMNSLVKGHLERESVYAGNPIKKIRTGIAWNRCYISI